MRNRNIILAGAALATVGLGCKEESVNHRMLIDVKGEGGQVPLVLVGGGLTGWLSFEPHQARLASGRRVARAQLLSVQVGLENRRLPRGYSVKTESTALGAGLDDAGLTGPIDLVAWSYGAYTSLDFALDNPERVRTLTLIEPPAVWTLAATGMMDERSEEELEAMRRLYAGMGGDDVTEDELASFVCQAGLCPPDTSPRDLPQWPVWVEHRRSLLLGDSWISYQDTLERLRAFDRPVLLVKGTGSSHFLHRIIDALAVALPKREVLELPGGHAPQIVSMDAFLDRLAAFQAQR
jgi:pimeloyl-ACP methyl ester carboxylesterase